MNKINEIGNQLVALALKGNSNQIVDSLYADNVISIEAIQGGGPSREITGKDAVLKKALWWMDNNKIHDVQIRGPFPHGDRKFAVFYRYELTNKESGDQPFTLEEIGVYSVSDGKIVREEYFYNVD